MYFYCLNLQLATLHAVHRVFAPKPLIVTDLAVNTFLAKRVYL